MRPRLVIFDCDGVLVNTEPLYFAMNRDFIRAHGGDFDFAYYEHFVGLSAELIWAELRATFALPQEVHELISLEKERKRVVLGQAELKPAIGVCEFLDLLAQRLNASSLKIAATAAWQRRLRACTAWGYANPDSGKQDLSAAQLVIHSFTDQRLIDLCR